MDLQTFFKAVLHHWWLIILSVLITGGSAAYFVSQQTPIYQARAQVWLKPGNLLVEPRQYLDALQTLKEPNTINTMARIATGTSMQDQVAKTLNVDVAYVQNANLTALVLPETQLIEIRAQSANANLAAAISNTVAEELRKQLPEGILQVAVINEATAPTTPFEPQPTRSITLGILVGVVLGVIFALLGHTLQTSQSAARRRSTGNTGKVPELAATIDSLDGQLSQSKTQQLPTH